MEAALPLQIIATLSDWASLAAAAAALLGLVFVWFQLRGTAASSRAQATIQFQEAFRRSAPARGRIQSSFPIHESVLDRLVPPEQRGDFPSWKSRDDLSEEQEADVKAVVNAMNDVAQYVADGLALRSALQQYHTVFVRLGMLVLPYVDARNAPVDGRPQARWGRRLVDLYNAGIDYHRHHPKHRGRELVLERVGKNGTDVRLVLLDQQGTGVIEHPGLLDRESPQPETLPHKLALRSAIRKAEQALRS